jgi:hypothetical protein
MPKVNLGRIRTVFKGEWVPGTYVIDDVVLYAGSAYTCIAIAALSNNPTDTSFWVKSAGGIEFAGVWDTATTYKVNQIVTFNGATYIAITAHSATEPTTSGQTDWITMSGGLKFEGAWNIGTTYQINDLVTFNGSAFISISNHTGTQPEPAGNAAWAVFAGGFQFEGAWNSGIAYQTNDLVTFNGSSYIAISDHTGTQPEPAGNAAWIVFASGLQFEGAWDTSTAYHVNDITILNGSSYIAISDHTGTQPEPAGNAAWVLFASGGDIADQTGNDGKVLSTDGTSTSWANVGVTELGITDGSAGDYLSTDGSGTLSFATPSSGGGGGGDWMTVGVYRRPIHQENQAFTSGGSSCTVSVPSSATKLVMEMWGAGGTGQSFCCMHGGYGGQGGSYGANVLDISSWGNTQVCLCGGAHGGYQCCHCKGPNGCHSWICTENSIDGYSCWCASGGEGGWNYCCCQNQNRCITNFWAGDWSPIMTGHGKDESSGCSAWNEYPIAGATTQCCCGNIPSCHMFTGEKHSSGWVRDVFCHAGGGTCGDGSCLPNFDLYVCGMCGWSEGSLACNYMHKCCMMYHGNGGASYAGGTYSLVNSFCCGCAPAFANFPGGGGQNRKGGASGCHAAAGGAGLVLLSWS